MKCFFIFAAAPFFDFFCRQNLFCFRSFLYTMKKKSKKKNYNNFGISAVIVYFSLCLLIRSMGALLRVYAYLCVLLISVLN